MGNYAPTIDDVITFTCSAVIVDDNITDNGRSLPITLGATFNLGAYALNKTQMVLISRNGSEIPSIDMNATFTSPISGNLGPT